MARSNVSQTWLEKEFGLVLHVPEVGNRYELYDKIGGGGAGQIFLAEDLDLRRKVALKILHSERKTSRDAVVRFLNEARITARLHHPGIVPIHDIGLINGELFFSMERVEGDTLHDLLRNARKGSAKALPQHRLLQIFEQVCHIVGYAHSRGIVHRDLKPANIMIGAHNKVYVMDWGLALDKIKDDSFARALEKHMSKDQQHPSETGHIQLLAGTPAYMAPEQILGLHDQLDARCDVFALGVILYEILAGSHPFEKSAPRDTMHAIKEAEPPPIRLLGNGDLKLVCRKALEKIPLNRYESAAELADDVNCACNLLPVTVSRSKLFDRSYKFARRHWIVAMAVLLMIMGGVAIGYSRYRDYQEIQTWINLANLRLENVAELRQQAGEIERRMQVASAASRPRFQQNLDRLANHIRKEELLARTFFELAMRRGPAHLSFADKEALKGLWLEAMEEELKVGNLTQADLIYQAVAAETDLAVFFSWSPEEKSRLHTIQQLLNPPAAE